MSHVKTTIWDLAEAIIEETDLTAEGVEAEILAVAAVADVLHRARLIDEPEAVGEPRRPLAAVPGRSIQAAV